MKKAMLTGIAIASMSMIFLLGGCGSPDTPEDAAIPESETIEYFEGDECANISDPEYISADAPEYVEANEPKRVEADEPERADQDEPVCGSMDEDYCKSLSSEKERSDIYDDNCDYVDEVYDNEEDEMYVGEMDDDETNMGTNEDINEMILEEIKSNMPGTWTYSNEVDNVFCEMHFAADGTVKLEAYDYDHETEDISCGTWRVAREDDNAVLVLRMPNKFYNFETRWALCDCYFDGSVDLSGLSFFYDTEINASGYFTKAY